MKQINGMALQKLYFTAEKLWVELQQPPSTYDGEFTDISSENARRHYKC